MKSINLILLATAVLAIASLVVGITIQAQAKSPNANNQYIFNQHSHSNIADLKGNDGSVTNTDGYHNNINDNTNREGDSPAERSHVNCHLKPAKTSGQCPPSS